MRKALLATLCLFAVFAVADQGHRHEGRPEQLGKVDFPTSCSAGSQKRFERALALLHSFWYEVSEKSFRALAEKDKRCPIAWWGYAMSLYHPLWEQPDADTLSRGAEALEKAKSGSTRRTTQREREYIAALSEFYRDYQHRDHRTRAQAWSAAMAKLSQDYPHDDEAAIFYALSLLGIPEPGQKSQVNHRKAGVILEPIFARHPEHPGVAHYLIHSYDSAELAPRGLNAARRYARIAPSVPHALHMPSHIFERLGLWDDSIASNMASAEAARKHRINSPGAAVGDEIHALDFLAYAYLQIGQDKYAQAALERAEQVAKQFGKREDYAAEIRAMYAIERRDWEQAASLQVPASTSAYDAALWWARAMGAAHIGKPDAIREAITKIEQIRDRLAAEKNTTAADNVEVLRIQAAGWLANAKGDPAKAIELMRAAADKEDIAGPAGRMPARQVLAELLLELNRPAEALAEYETALKAVPRRFNIVYGAARAAELAGNSVRALELYRDVVELARNGDTDRPELQQSRSFVSKAATQQASR